MKRAPTPVIDRSDANWHVDRKVPVAVIIMLALQTGGFIWWGAKADERLSTLERKVEFAAPQADRLTRVEVNIEAIKDSLSEIKSRLRPRT
jgi:Tfp pilus assembly protein PilO